MSTISKLIIPLFVLFVVFYAFKKKVMIYDTFLEGAKEGLITVFHIFPSIIAMVFAINIFLNSHLLETMFSVISPILTKINLPLNILPMAFVRQQLEYILAVDTYRHFAKAAEHCRVTQPTLSMMIQKLEDELGIKLFDRNLQPVRPTPAGRKVIEQARNVLYQASLIKDIVNEEEQSLKGTFRLAVLPTIAPYLLPRFFQQLSEKHTDLDIRMLEMKTAPTMAALQNGEIDAAIIANQPTESYLQGDILYYEQFFGYVAHNESIFKKDLIRTADINDERLWLLDEGHCFRDQLMRFCQMEKVKVRQAAYRLGSLETFMRMVESGNGITFIPELATLQLSKEQKELVRPFAIPKPTREIVFVTRKDFIRHTVAGILIESIKKAVPKEMLTLQPGQKVV